jgi:hypothetical protein
MCNENFSMDNIKKQSGYGYWDYKLTGGTCLENICSVSDINLNIFFHFNGPEKSAEVNIKSHNRTIVGMDNDEIMKKLLEKANKPEDVCK